jgi:hypothetical protein
MENKVKVNTENIAGKIYFIHGERIMLDVDLANLYNVPVKSLKQAVRRNIKRFPPDFMFVLTSEEHKNLRSQFVTLGWGRYSKYLPFAFTEQGIAMLSGILNSDRAINVNIAIMRAFVKIGLSPLEG